MKPRNIKINLAVLIISLAVCLVLMELLLRYMEPFPPGVMELNEKYIYSPKKNARSVFKHFPQDGGKIIPYKFNDMGFRGENFTLTKKNGKRVVVYGDSFIQSSYVNLPDTFSEQLEQKLSAKLNSNIEVINAGVSGYGPDQISLKMEDEIGLLKPDLLIVSFYTGNDFGDLFRNNLFRLDDDDKLIKNTKIISQAIRKKYKYKQKEARGIELQKLVMRLSDVGWVKDRLIPFIKGWLGMSMKNDESSYFDEILKAGRVEYETYIADDKNSEENPMDDIYDADLSVYPDSEASRLKIKLMDKIIERMNSIIKRNNIPVIMMILPSRMDVCEQYVLQVDQSLYKDYKRDFKTSLIESSVKKYDIDFINMFSFFKNSQCNKNFFKVGNNHWNEIGQEKAARLMAERIVNSFILN